MCVMSRKQKLVLPYANKKDNNQPAHSPFLASIFTVKILKIGTTEIITIIVLLLEQLDFTVQYCVQRMQTE